MAYRDYSSAYGHIVDPNGNGDFTTLSAALVAASAGETIFLRPGTYAGGTLKAGVNITAFACDSSQNGTGNVNINGPLVFSSAGSCSISGVQLQSDSSNFLTVSGSVASIVNMENCFFNCTTATGISFTSSSATAAINCKNCTGDLTTNGAAIYAMTSPGTLSFNDCDFTNSGLSTAQNGNSAGSVYFKRGTCMCQIATTVVGNFFAQCLVIDTSAVTVPCVVNSGSTAELFSCVINAGNAEAAQTTGALVIFNCFVDSGASNAITGSGAIFYTDLSFGSNSNITVAGQNVQVWKPWNTAGSAGAATRGTAAFDDTYFTSVDGWVSLVAPPTGISTLTGDTGSATGSTVKIFANTASQGSGSSVSTAASAAQVLLNLSDSNDNTILGSGAGNVSISGSSNASIGHGSLSSLTTGSSNTFAGPTVGASITTGSNNLFLGNLTGSACTFGSESSNVYLATVGIFNESNTIRIGTQGTGTGQQNSTYIAGIQGTTITGGFTVLCDVTGKLGTVVSSRKYKKDIVDSDASIMGLRPVKFSYIADDTNTPVYGLIAEEVADVIPDLVIYKDGEADSIKYHELPALLLKEIQRLSARIDALENKQ